MEIQATGPEATGRELIMGMNNIEAILGCRKTFDLTPSEFLFLWYLAFKGNDEDRDIAVRGEAWPGEKTIEKEIGLNEDTTRKAANRMSNLGILTVHKPGYKDRSSKTYLIHYDKLPVSESPPPTRSITDPQSADYRPPLGDLPTPGRPSTDRTGIELELEKKSNGNKQTTSSVRDPICSPQTTGETPVPPEEQEKLEWAKGLTPYPCWIGWKKFTDNPKSFRTACLDSETFNKQFAERKKKPKPGENGYKNPAHHNGSEAFLFAPESPERKAACEAEDLERQKRRAEEKRAYEAPRTCAHCKTIGEEILRHGYCSNCIHHHPDPNTHWYYCKCEKCIERWKANPIKKASAPKPSSRIFDEVEDP